MFTLQWKDEFFFPPPSFSIFVFVWLVPFLPPRQTSILQSLERLDYSTSYYAQLKLLDIQA